MNTGRDETHSPSNIDIFDTAAISPVDRSAAALEAAYQAEQDKRREERFFWIAAVAFFAAIGVFRGMPWLQMLLLFLFEVAILLSLAKWLGLEHVAVPLENLYNKYLATVPKRKED